MGTGIITKHPFKFLYVLLALAFNSIRLWVWCFKYTFPALRPVPSWTFRQALMVRIIKALIGTQSRVNVKTPLSLIAGKEKDKFVLIPPASATSYTGIARAVDSIVPGDIGAVWYSQPYTTGEATKVVIHFHGGAYIIGDARPNDTKFLGETLAKSGNFKVLCPAYRLASNEGGAFPAPLQDAISAYAYVVRVLGVPPKQIILSGDSAGAHLTLALLRYIKDHGPSVSLPLPCGAMLWSAWVDVPGRLNMRLHDSPHYHSDYIHEAFIIWGRDTFLKNVKKIGPSAGPYMCTIDAPFSTCPLFIHTGTSEVLYDDDVLLADQMQKVPGNKVHLQLTKNAPHDILLVGHIAGWVKEAHEAAKKAGAWAAAL